MKKLILKSRYAVGDIVMLTAAVRDLHRCYPGSFLTDVRTPFPDLWRNNPYLSPLREEDADVTTLDCDDLIAPRANQVGTHFLQHHIEFLNQRLGLEIELTEFKGDIHLSAAEKSYPSPLLEMTGVNLPFWIVVTGGKFDMTIKWWDAERYQQVADHFRGKIQFLQVGGVRNHHPKLENVIDLRGKTDLRQLIRLVYHAQGVLCGVTSLMHLAAAVECVEGQNEQRPCVVVAGGRETAHKEAYPGHQFIHTIGALRCCASGGCWKARTLPLWDGDDRDKPEYLCVDVRGELPRCMDMITAQDVVRRIETYFENAVRTYLTPEQAKAAAQAVSDTRGNPYDSAFVTVNTVRDRSEEFIKTIPPYPDRFQGRGIVICAGGFQYFTNAWVCINMLRRSGCTLPIELWHRDAQEMDDRMRALMAPLGVECIDASAVLERYPARVLHGFALKPYAILHCRFREVLFLDADNVPVTNPEFFFETPQFRNTGAIFWPDYARTEAPQNVWKFCGIPYRKETPFESGQIVLEKKKCWQALCLTLWYNEYSQFFYNHVLGDKETFHLAFRKLGKAFSMVPIPLHPLKGTMCQHDFRGRRVFQHRNLLKWRLIGENPRIRGFWHENECRAFLDQLRQQWDGRMEYYRAIFDLKSGTRGKRPQASRPVRITAVMSTCKGRERICSQTLRSLAASDWDNRPVLVQTDPAKFEDRMERLAHNGYLALSRSLQTEAEYILYLEDDLLFNRFFFHNLQAWEPLRNNEIGLAGLCHSPHAEPLAFDARNDFFLINPKRACGSQAYLISRAMVKFAITHWADPEVPRSLDLKLIYLANLLKRPIFYHTPSLVQHTGKKGIVNGSLHNSVDFDHLWKA